MRDVVCRLPLGTHVRQGATAPGCRACSTVASVTEVGAGSFPVLDSSTVVDERVLASWRAMSAHDRLDHVAGLNELCDRLAEAGVRARYPLAGDDECRLRVLALRLGRQLMVDVYDWDPAAEGW